MIQPIRKPSKSLIDASESTCDDGGSQLVHGPPQMPCRPPSPEDDTSFGEPETDDIEGAKESSLESDQSPTGAVSIAETVGSSSDPLTPHPISHSDAKYGKHVLHFVEPSPPNDGLHNDTAKTIDESNTTRTFDESNF